MAGETIHTYCAHSKSRCGVICTVEDGVFKKVELIPSTPTVASASRGLRLPKSSMRLIVFNIPCGARARRTAPIQDGNGSLGMRRLSWQPIDSSRSKPAMGLKQLSLAGLRRVEVLRTTLWAGSSWLQRLANAFGSPNLLATGHICNWHKDTGSKYTYGVGIPAPDFEHADCILLWGHNPEASWPAHAKRIMEARRREGRSSSSLILARLRWQRGLTSGCRCDPARMGRSP